MSTLCPECGFPQLVVKTMRELARDLGLELPAPDVLAYGDKALHCENPQCHSVWMIDQEKMDEALRPPPMSWTETKPPSRRDMSWHHRWSMGVINPFHKLMTPEQERAAFLRRLQEKTKKWGDGDIN